MVDARDVAEISIALRNSDSRPEGRHLLVGENKSFKEYFDMACSIAGSARPKFGLPNWLVLSVARGIKLFESLGLWSFKVNSSSLVSACRVTVFSNDKVRKLGYSFRPISESVAYSLEVKEKSLI